MISDKDIPGKRGERQAVVQFGVGAVVSPRQMTASRSDWTVSLQKSETGSAAST
jgi:hypothetical protein